MKNDMLGIASGGVVCALCICGFVFLLMRRARAGVALGYLFATLHLGMSALYAQDVRVQPTSLGIVLPSGEFASEHVRGRTALFSDSFDYIRTTGPASHTRSLMLEMDMPAIDGSTKERRLFFAFSTFEDFRQEGTAKGFFNFSSLDDIQITGACGEYVAVALNPSINFNTLVGEYHFKSSCPAQKLRIRVQAGASDVSDDGEGTFFLSIGEREDTGVFVYTVTVPKREISEKRAFTPRNAYKIDTPAEKKANGETGFVDDNVLATISGGDFALDSSLQLEAASLFEPDVTIHPRDVKLLVLVESDNKALLENFAIRQHLDSPHKLRIRSNIKGTVPGYFLWWEARQSLYALISRNAEQGEVFTIYAEDNSSDTAYAGLEESSTLKVRTFGMLLRTSTMAGFFSNGIKDRYGALENRNAVVYSVQDSIMPDGVIDSLSDISYSEAVSAPIRISSELKLITAQSPDSFTRFIVPWVYEGEALAGQGEQVVTTSLQLSNLTNKTIGPVRATITDSNKEIPEINSVLLLESIGPYSSIEMTSAMVGIEFGDFIQGTLALTIGGASPQDLTLRRFTDVGGDVYIDNFGSAESFNEFNPG